MANRSKNENKIYRVIFLYHLLSRCLSDGGLRFKEIMEYYRDEIGYTGNDKALRRVIHRDIEALEQVGIIVNRSAQREKRYSLDYCYIPRLTRESAAAIYTSMLIHQGTLLNSATDEACTEIQKAFFRQTPELAQLIKQRVHYIEDTLTSPQEFEDLLGKLIRAVVRQFMIKINYQNNNGEIKERLLEPVGMVCKRMNWYLIARRPDREEFRTYRVDQIKAITLRERDIFNYPDDFDLDQYCGTSWGIYNNDPVTPVIIKFSKKVSNRIKNVCYHPTQQIIEECPDGSVIVVYQVCGLIELKGWLMQWGPQVEVLEPEFLRQEMYELAMSIAKLYEKEGDIT